MTDALRKVKEIHFDKTAARQEKCAGRRERAMKVLKSTIASLLLTATQVMAYGEAANGEGPSLLMICFMGFGALVIVFQIFPAAILFWGMAKGLITSAGKSGHEATAGNPDKD
jgi:hypothetical protein